MNDLAPAVKKLLRQAGWEFYQRGRGDHDVWHNPQTAVKVTIDQKIKSRHTANDILKEAGLRKQF